MKGLIEIKSEALIKLAGECAKHIANFDMSPYLVVERRLKLFKMRYEEVRVYSGLPSWHQYQDSLCDHLNTLIDNAVRANEDNTKLWLSELSYTHLVKLANGDNQANPIYIMNY